MNKVILIGNLANDPEARTTQSGISQSRFTIAVNRRFANQQGVREADFIPVVAWRQNADFCNRYLSKGRRVAVEGSIQVRPWASGNEIKRQMDLNRTIPEISGECFYSTRPLLKNPRGVCDSIKRIYADDDAQKEPLVLPWE